MKSCGSPVSRAVDSSHSSQGVTCEAVPRRAKIRAWSQRTTTRTNTSPLASRRGAISAASLERLFELADIDERIERALDERVEHLA